MAGAWTCSICNEVFHDSKEYERHWDFEMEMALDAWKPEMDGVHRPENKFKISSKNKGDEDLKTVQFRSCFEPTSKTTGPGIPKEKKFSPACFDTRQRCPICNKLFTQAELELHVEEELEIMDGIGLSAPRTTAGRRRDASGVLVLGGVPKPRKRFKRVEDPNQQREQVFNHYADGKGWWDESSIGIESSNAELSWEGLGSVTFGEGM